MSALDSLPADQRAVLQLVLQRGRSYDDIAQLLSIDRAGVRDRALRAFDALGPQTGVPPERRALVTDYLLGQLPPRVEADTRARLAASAPERAWARVIAGELSTLGGERLREIPASAAVEDLDEAERSGRGARGVEPVAAAPSLPRRRDRRDEPELIEDRGGDGEPRPDRDLAYGRGRGPDRGEPRVPLIADDDGRPTSRRGGALLLGAGALLVLIVVIVLLAGSSGSSKHTTSSTQASATTTSSSASGSVSSSTTTSASGTPTPIAQINLTSPSGNQAAGVAIVVKQGSTVAIVIKAQHIPANTAHNAYAVWLSNSSSDSQLLGFVNPGVKANGTLTTAGALPTNASHFKQLLVTLETVAKPHSPGTIVLQGQLTGVP